MTIGDRIKKRREELGMSQDELARKIGYKSRSSINKIELNQYNLQQSKIKAIADALQTTPSYIMGWEEKESRLQQELSTTKAILDIYGKKYYKMFHMFDMLNDEGKTKALNYLSDVCEMDKYIRDNFDEQTRYQILDEDV